MRYLRMRDSFRELRAVCIFFRFPCTVSIGKSLQLEKTSASPFTACPSVRFSWRTSPTHCRRAEPLAPGLLARPREAPAFQGSEDSRLREKPAEGTAARRPLGHHRSSGEFFVSRGLGLTVTSSQNMICSLRNPAGELRAPLPSEACEHGGPAAPHSDLTTAFASEGCEIKVRLGRGPARPRPCWALAAFLPSLLDSEFNLGLDLTVSRGEKSPGYKEAPPDARSQGLRAFKSFFLSIKGF
ncbi:uncharacterized protein LOC110350928 [Heterocephalus glaber]|uniref:Uncharacterized protein LOC110350928 n=1 Tax=Heterocephalus glaber TaxID=10181 RepID=A0AAX6TKB9_HETGA|nr:uncharacterized protein LOC110350928 [Heterocephalus glaber]